MHADTHCTGPIESVQILLKGHSSCCVLIFVFSVEYFLCLQFERAFKRIFNKNKNHSGKVTLRRNKSGIQDRRKVESVYKRKRKKSHSRFWGENLACHQLEPKTRPKRKWYIIKPFPHFGKSGNGFMLYHFRFFKKRKYYFRILKNAEIRFLFLRSRQIHLSFPVSRFFFSI